MAHACMCFRLYHQRMCLDACACMPWALPLWLYACACMPVSWRLCLHAFIDILTWTCIHVSCMPTPIYMCLYTCVCMPVPKHGCPALCVGGSWMAGHGHRWVRWTRCWLATSKLGKMHCFDVAKLVNVAVLAANQVIYQQGRCVLARLLRYCIATPINAMI